MKTFSRNCKLALGIQTGSDDRDRLCKVQTHQGGFLGRLTRSQPGHTSLIGRLELLVLPGRFLHRGQRPAGDTSRTHEDNQWTHRSAIVYRTSGISGTSSRFGLTSYWSRVKLQSVVSGRHQEEGKRTAVHHLTDQTGTKRQPVPQQQRLGTRWDIKRQDDNVRALTQEEVSCDWSLSLCQACF